MSSSFLISFNPSSRLSLYIYLIILKYLCRITVDVSYLCFNITCFPKYISLHLNVLASIITLLQRLMNFLGVSLLDELSRIGTFRNVTTLSSR